MTAIELAKQVRSSGNISEEIAAKVKAVVSNDTSGEVFDANEGFRFEVIKEVAAFCVLRIVCSFDICWSKRSKLMEEGVV